MPFRITKWYVDAISPEGRVCVGYRARLATGPCSLRVAAVLRAATPGALEESSSLCSWGRMSERPGLLWWQCTRLNLEGTWRATAAPVERMLLEGPAGSIVWRCLMPAADTEITENGGRWSGRGYAERLEMTLPTWHVPIDELLWGRFVGPSSSIVWIRWRGEHPLSIVLYCGREDPGVVFRSDRLEAPGRWTLALCPPDVLRDDTLERASLRPLGLLARTIPSRIRRTRETKWLARATLRRPTTPEVESGWALHERVIFERE